MLFACRKLYDELKDDLKTVEISKNKNQTDLDDLKEMVNTHHSILSKIANRSKEKKSPEENTRFSSTNSIQIIHHSFSESINIQENSSRSTPVSSNKSLKRSDLVLTDFNLIPENTKLKDLDPEKNVDFEKSKKFKKNVEYYKDEAGFPLIHLPNTLKKKKNPAIKNKDNLQNMMDLNHQVESAGNDRNQKKSDENEKKSKIDDENVKDCEADNELSLEETDDEDKQFDNLKVINKDKDQNA